MIVELRNSSERSVELDLIRSKLSNNWLGRGIRSFKNFLFTGLAMQAIPSTFAQTTNSEPCLNGTFVAAPENNATQLHSYMWRVIPTLSNAFNSSAASTCCEQMETTFNAVIEELSAWVNRSHSSEMCEKNATEIFSFWSNGESLALWLQSNTSNLLSSLCSLGNGNFPIANEEIQSLREQWAQCEEENSTAFHFQWWHATLSFCSLFGCYLSIALCARYMCRDKPASEPAKANLNLRDTVPLVVYKQQEESASFSKESELEQLAEQIEIEIDAEGNTIVVD